MSNEHNVSGGERDDALPSLEQIAHLDAYLEHLGAGLAAQRVGQLVHGLGVASQRLGQVDRYADGVAVIANGPRDGLADPPHGIGAEAVAALPLILLYRMQEAHVTLRDEVFEWQAAVAIVAGDGHDEAQIGLRQGVGRLRLTAGHPLGQRYLLLRSQEWRAANLTQVTSQQLGYGRGATSTSVVPVTVWLW